MATEKKPAAKPAASTRKKTTKRGPTKAAALKALGLTKEDLELVAQVNEARAIAAQERELQVKTEVQQESKTQAAEVLSDPAPVESVKESGIPVFFVRNQTNCEVGLRLDRQSDRSKKRIDLKPRGQRGDLAKLQEGDLDDTTLLDNVHLNVVEIITASEAKEVISKQSTNQQQAVHPAMASLRNELNQPYEQGQVKVDAEFNSQGVTVAHLNPQGGGAGALPDLGRRGIDWQAARQGTQGQPNNVGPGGNPAIISDGFAPNDSAAQADAIARRRDLEGPAAAGITTVYVGETEKA